MVESIMVTFKSFFQNNDCFVTFMCILFSLVHNILSIGQLCIGFI